MGNPLHPDDPTPEMKAAAALKKEAFHRYLLQHLAEKGSFTSTNPIVQRGFAELEERGWVRCDAVSPPLWNLVRAEADWFKPMKRAQRCHLTDEGSLQLRAYPSTIGKRYFEFTGEDEEEFEAK
jgi:hypothetical protein